MHEKDGSNGHTIHGIVPCQMSSAIFSLTALQTQGSQFHKTVAIHPVLHNRELLLYRTCDIESRLR